MIRKLTTLLLCLLLTTISSLAQIPNNEIWYTTTDGERISIVLNSYYNKNPIISHTYKDGKGVIRMQKDITVIGGPYLDNYYDITFNGCKTLKTVTLPQSTGGIVTDAFYDCENLTRIDIPNSGIFFDSSPFHGCTSLTSITFPDDAGFGDHFSISDCPNLKTFKGKCATPDGKCIIQDGILVAFASAGVTSYAIPEGVTGLGWYVMSNCSDLTSITLPNSLIYYIDEGALLGNKRLKTFKGKYASADGRCLIKDGALIAFAPAGLTSYTLPQGITEIGWCVFENFTNLRSITIPNSVTCIHERAFSGCTNLTSINIPNKVTKIWDNTFSDCTNLTSITIPNSVTEIEGGAFSGCTSLTSINIPNSVTKIGRYAFSGCTGLKSFKGKYASSDGRCLIKDGVLIAFAPAGLTSYTIPYDVTKIDGSAFFGCTCLKSFKGKYASSDGRCLIEDGALIAFAPAGLTSYTIPNGVTEIEEYAFEGCTSLKRITIPNSVTKIEDGAFGDCTSLKSITIPDSVTDIGYRAFEGCTSLTSINIPDSVTEIGGAFWGCTSLTSITIPDSVTQIGEWAFYGCKSLTNINIPNSVTRIGYRAFEGCTSLTSINIPNSITEIGEGAFAGCNIEQITISAVTGNIFQDGNGLDPSKVVAYTGKYASEDGRCLIKDGVLIDYIHNGAERYEIPNGVTTISYEVFKGCSSLKSITIPESVTSIGSSAFKGCTSLTSITIPDNVTEIGWHAFLDCTSLTSINIPNSVTKIWNGTFSGCTGLTSITIPDSVTEIEDDAFEGCNIEQITISAVTGNIFRGCNGLDPSKVVAYTGKYASEDGRCLIKDGVFIDIIHTGLTSYVIPENITTIGKGVFKGCSTLKEITIPNSVTMIGEGAFQDCNIERITINAVTGNIFRGCDELDPSKVVAYTGKYASEDGRCLIKDGVLIDFILGNLTSYAIPEGVKVINPEVFSHCYILTDITIPATVTQIGDNVFAGGSPWLSITCLSTTPPQATTLGISKETTIYVPKKSVSAYKKAEGWTKHKKQIKRIKVEK